MWSWRAGGGLGKAGGSVRQRTNKTGGFAKAQVGTAEYAGLEGWRARPRGWDGLGGTQILILRIRR